MEKLTALLDKQYALLTDYSDRTAEIILIQDPELVPDKVQSREDIITQLKSIRTEIAPYLAQDSIKKALSSGIQLISDLKDVKLRQINTISVETNKLILTIGNKDKMAQEKMLQLKNGIMDEIRTSSQNQRLVSVYNATINDTTSDVGSRLDERM